MIRIGVISDTHGLLRPEVIVAMKTCDMILHAGDINHAGILEKLREIAPVTVVRGNNDKEWAEDIPYFAELSVEGRKLCMAHIKKTVPKDTDADIIICGHTHKYREERIGETIWLNPGSCGRGRFNNKEITFAIMTVNGRDVKIEKRVIEV